MLPDGIPAGQSDRTRELNQPAGHIPALDGWRGIAILMVLFAHGVQVSRFLPVDFGSSGVTLFMILSGYLITTRLLTSYWLGNKVDFRRFYTLRAFRILPPIIVYLAVLALLAAVSPQFQTSRTELIASLLFWRNYLLVPSTTELSGWFTGHFWSLAVEEHFYLLWPIVIHLSGRKRSLYAALAGALVCALWRWAGWQHGLSLGAVLDRIPYFFRTDTRIDALLLGSAAAIALSHPAWETSIRRYLPARATGIGLFLLALLWLFAGHWFIGLKEEFALTVLLIITVLYREGALAKALAWAPLRTVGKLSYSLYIWQQLFLLPRNTGWWNSFPVNFLLVAAAAVTSYLLIEEPARRLGRRFFEPGIRSTAGLAFRNPGSRVAITTD